MNLPKVSIKQKIVIFISLTSLFLVAIGLVSGYFAAYDLMKKSIFSDYEKISYVLASNVSERFNEEIDYLEGLTLSSNYLDTVKEINLRYQGMDQDSIQKFMADMDRDWVSAGKDSFLVGQYLKKSGSLELEKRYRDNEEAGEIFITDGFGGIALASGKTTDFYQADELWWQRAFNEGKGGVFVGDIGFDESSSTLGITFALPIKNDDNKVIGVVKMVVNANNFFAFLRDFKIGKTGHAHIMNEKGEIIFYPGIIPLSRKLLLPEDLQEVLNGETNQFINNSPGIHPKDFFSIFIKIKTPLFLDQGIIWYVGVEQDVQEIFAPLKRLTFYAQLLAGFLILIISGLGFIFARVFIRPIAKLKQVSQHISNGVFDYSVDIRTGDEFEDLAGSFRIMSLKIKEREEQIIVQKEYIEKIISSMTDALVVINFDATIRLVNKSALDLLGYCENELIGQPIQTIFLQEEDVSREGESILNKYFKNIIDQGSAHNIALTLLTKKGKRIPINFSGAVIREADKMTGIVGVARDMRQIMGIISDLKEKERSLTENAENLTRMQRAMVHIMGDLKNAKEELEKALSVKSEITEMVSHELRTPLSAIKEGISLVLDKLVGGINAEQEKYLVIVKRNVDRLARLIDGVLDFQQLDSGKMEFRMEENEISELIKETYQTMLPLAEKKNLGFMLNLDKEIPKVKFDQDKINQVLVNLINNAIKFTEVGTITIDLVNKETFIQVSVVDTGIGIKTEDLPKLFKQFTQLQRRIGGAGLGLSICKKIIEAHKGKIWEEPGIGGRGSIFHFTLPIIERRV
ncbi:MAG: ATP-binding protein [Candidatus Omnitrophota bacterium]